MGNLKFLILCHLTAVLSIHLRQSHFVHIDIPDAVYNVLDSGAKVLLGLMFNLYPSNF